MLYKLIDKSTNTILENLTSNDIARMLGVTKQYVLYSARTENLIQLRYKVELIANEQEYGKKIPDKMWAEWEKVRKPLNKAIKLRGKDIELICVDAN